MRRSSAPSAEKAPAIPVPPSPQDPPGPDEPAELKPEDTDVLFPADIDKDLLREFISESLDYVEGAEASLLQLETDPDDREAVNTVFRAFHTVKGTSGFLGLNAVSRMAHLAESLLSRMRDREIRCVGGYADLALRSADMLKQLILMLRQSMNSSEFSLPDGYPKLMETLANPEAAGISGERPDNAGFVMRLGDILVASNKATREEVEAAAAAAAQGGHMLGEALVKSHAVSLPDLAEALRIQRSVSGSEKQVESSVRVKTDRMDRLIDMIGELVIAQSIVDQDPVVGAIGNHELQKKVTHAGKIVRELHDLSMSMRMVPLRATFQKMARLVRDLAQKSGKIITFVAEGEETEIDRNMVDSISDALVHMVRNAVDHGIEPPGVRERIGKPWDGRIRLSACHSGGNVIVIVQDDGRGLDRGKIAQKAISKGLVASEKGMSEREIFNLILAPGFSTADQVTEVSGRGVGMDVVRRNVEALRGHVEISSKPGNGSTFALCLPITLAITDGMLVKVGPERYIIPTNNIHLSFRPERESVSTVEGRGEMVMLRGELMTIFRLYRLFQVQDAVQDLMQGLLVVVGDGNRRCAFLVDELLGQQQVVAKSLGAGVGKIQGVSGGAILGDGRVGLILDPAEVLALALQTGSNGHEETKSKCAALYAGIAQAAKNMEDVCADQLRGSRPADNI